MSIDVRGVTKRFGDFVALDDVSVTVYVPCAGDVSDALLSRATPLPTVATVVPASVRPPEIVSVTVSPSSSPTPPPAASTTDTLYGPSATDAAAPSDVG